MKRLLIFASKLGYQTRSFAQAARTLGVEVAFATDRCHQLDDPWADAAIPLHFENPVEAAETFIARTVDSPVHGIVALGDRAVPTAAHAARTLGISFHPPDAVENCRSKLRQRFILSAAGVQVPEFLSISLREPVESVVARVSFPCVIKPLRLAASQGVIRANNPGELRAAVERVRALLESPEIQVTRDPDLDRLLVETYIHGAEVAVEGVLTRGRYRILAIFDKPDPLEGPYFEETIYVTPSRLSKAMQTRIAECAAAAVKTLGLTHGPVHAEFRVNDEGPWVLEVAPHPIGGLCSRALCFGPRRMLLEELLVRHALNLPGSGSLREKCASGVMMIPVPKSGILKAVEGLHEALAEKGIDDVQITARLHDFIAAWPEGSSYLGFIFARGASPREVEDALRAAHGRLRFEIVPRLAAEHPVTRKLPDSRFAP